MSLRTTRLKGRSGTVTPPADKISIPSTPFEPTSETVEQVTHTLDSAGNTFPDILARCAVSTALRVNATSPESPRVPGRRELTVALEALLDMPAKSTRRSSSPERPWEQDHRGAAVAMLTALHKRASEGRS